MERRGSPRGLISRSLIAVALFAAAMAPGWTLGDLTERETGSGLLDWVVTGAWTGLAVRVLAPWASYRARDGWLGVIPVYGWYLTCVLSWRVALLPYRDWDPRSDELWRARWLTGDLLGYWRADHAPAEGRPRRAAPRRPARAVTGPAAGRRTR